jgi:hypothetical protein
MFRERTSLLRPSCASALVGFRNNKSSGVCPGRSRDRPCEGCGSDAFADCGQLRAGPGCQLRCRRTEARKTALSESLMKLFKLLSQGRAVELRVAKQKLMQFARLKSS